MSEVSEFLLDLFFKNTFRLRRQSEFTFPVFDVIQGCLHLVFRDSSGCFEICEVGNAVRGHVVEVLLCSLCSLRRNFRRRLRFSFWFRSPTLTHVSPLAPPNVFRWRAPTLERRQNWNKFLANFPIKHTRRSGTGVADPARAIRTSQPDRHGPYYDPYTGVRVGDYDRVYNTETRTSKTDRFGRTRPS
jgi:hypothetical protein